MRWKILHKLILFSMVILLAACPSTASVAAEQRPHKIAVVKSWDLPEYNLALEGFFGIMTERGIKLESAAFDLKGQMENGRKIAKQIREFNPDMILTVGSRATSAISKYFEDTPIVFTMVLYPVASAFVSTMETPGRNITGSSMDVPIERQFRELSRIVLGMKRIGVLYSPQETQAVIERARSVAESLDMKLLTEEIKSESDVPNALNKLIDQKIDALWSVADGNVFTPRSTKYIISHMVRTGLPFMGPHNGFVKAGALVALTADYTDNGRQAAELSIRILHGANAGNIAVATPRRVEMALNLQVANHIGLRISEEIIDEASQIFD